MSSVNHIVVYSFYISLSLTHFNISIYHNIPINQSIWNLSFFYSIQIIKKLSYSFYDLYNIHSYTTTCALLNSLPFIMYPVLKQSATLPTFYFLSLYDKFSGTGIFIIPSWVFGSNSCPIGLNYSIPNSLYKSCNSLWNLFVYECVSAQISIYN